MVTIHGEVGPGGGDGGPNPWTFKPDGRITSIRITSGVVIDSIRFTYQDPSHVKHQYTYHEWSRHRFHQIVFDGDEDIVRVSGTIGEYEDTVVITSLSFYTNKGKTYGSYGTDKGISFSWTRPSTEAKFIGFYGSFGDYLNSFGVIFQTLQ